MTLPKYALKYWACTAEEMRTFIKNRTGAGAEPKKRREVYLKILRQLDEEAHFPRFLELPPELREFVYLELLEYDALRRTAFTEILRTSKLIYKESLPVLHDNSTVRLGAVFSHRGDPDETGAPSASAKLGQRRPQLSEARFSSGLTTLQAANWLHPFSSVRNFHVCLKLSGSVHGPTRQWILPPRFLEALVQTCKRARCLLLYVRDNGAENSAERLVEVLTPLKQLPVTCQLMLAMDDATARTAFLKMWRKTGKARLRKMKAKKIAREGKGEQHQDDHVREWDLIEAMGQGA